jgi:predicted dehydrogenase
VAFRCDFVLKGLLMINVGVIGLGMMGLTHLDAYSKRDDVKVVAISDKDPKRLSGELQATGNVDGQAQGGFDFDAVRKFDEGLDLINDPEVDVVDICLPTFLHLDYAVAACGADKHVLIEKPLARTSGDATKIIEAASKSKGIAMCAMCMRFWPGWTWLKDAIDNKTYGKVLAAQFRRVSDHPGGGFYANGDLCGGALLDLHIHDTDFIHYAFGVPTSVSSIGYAKVTDQPDHVVTQYRYDDGPMIVAEGGWAMTDGFGFKMQYTVNFETATAIFEFGADEPLTLIEQGKESQAVSLEDRMGYDIEIEYFIECIKAGTKPTTVTLEDAANTIKIIEAEGKSIASGQSAAVAI